MYEPKKPAATSDSSPAWFQKMDRNRDGEVSLREFLGPLSVFRRLDTNHDGYLDANEARGAMGEANREDK
jgi:Ca2+-binding EF-hand superfamily protein